MHGANRLGGNGVANSTVFGGLAGASMARFVVGSGRQADGDPVAIEAALDRVETPFRRRGGDLNALRKKLFEAMWEDVGILRTAEGLRRGAAILDELDRALDATGLGDLSRAYNLTWHDWLNQKNLVLVSRAITAAALERTDSRGAHFREEHPAAGDLATSRYTIVRQDGGEVTVGTAPVVFTRVAPGQSLLLEAAE